jgi:hypothetical protein
LGRINGRPKSRSDKDNEVRTNFDRAPATCPAPANGQGLLLRRAAQPNPTNAVPINSVDVGSGTMLNAISVWPRLSSDPDGAST